jgi:phage repressor protein C with HTH and peptisase S24 domain
VTIGSVLESPPHPAKTDMMVKASMNILNGREFVVRVDGNSMVRLVKNESVKNLFGLCD